MIEAIIFAVIAVAIWSELIGPLADRMAERDVEGWGRRND